MDDSRGGGTEASERSVQQLVTALFPSTQDTIRLNVGGTRVTTSRATLCQAYDSPLAALFSGRMDSRMSKDPEGAFVIDADPELVLMLIDYLRERRMTPSKQIVLPPVVPHSKEGAWRRLIMLTGMHDWLYGRNDQGASMDLRLDLVGPGLEQTGVATKASGSDDVALCSTPIEYTTTCAFKLVSAGEGFVGVTRDADIGMARRTEAFGFYFGSGEPGTNEMGVDLVKGDLVLIRVNMQVSKLQLMHPRLQLLYEKELPVSDVGLPWFLMVRLGSNPPVIVELRTASIKVVNQTFTTV